MSIASAHSKPLPPDFDRAAPVYPLPSALDALGARFLQATNAMVLVMDAHGAIVWANASARSALATGSVTGNVGRWADAWPLQHQAAASIAFALALAHGHASFSAATTFGAPVEPYWQVELTRISRNDYSADFVIAMAQEIKPAAVPVRAPDQSEKRDGLTGLPNAVQFHETLKARAVDQSPVAHPFGLIIIDVDRFKQLNAGIGPQACDAMLGEFAEVIAAEVGRANFVARSGGDEFALIIDDPSGTGAALHRIAPLIQQCAKRISCGDPLVSFSVSAGISLFPIDASSDQELIRNAHMALQAAKAAGGARSVTFDGGMRQQLQRHSAMLHLARAAIAGDWMRPYYQPKVDLSSGMVVGFEALLRWESSDGVIHLPASISAAFDDPAIASRISELMLQKVIADVSAWKQVGFALPVAINASAADFRSAGFATRFLQQLKDAELAPSLFELEVTEGVFLGVGAEDVSAALRTLNAAGIRIALDDFGTGFASLTHLKQHPVDVIKIDRSFVANLAASPDDRAIVSAMISLSKSLAIEVVAEGIETSAQLSTLQDMGCDTGQGFIFSQAVAGDDVPNIVRQHAFCQRDNQHCDT